MLRLSPGKINFEAMSNAWIRTAEAYEAACTLAADNPKAFWAEIASGFSWQENWEHVVEWDFQHHDVSWFRGGKLNITENTVKVHRKNLMKKLEVRNMFQATSMLDNI